MEETLVESFAGGAVVETVPRLCGCAGKTPLDAVVYPARRRIAERLADTPVRLAGAVDAALLPRRERLRRHVTQFRLGNGVTHQTAVAAPTDTASSTWVVGTTFAADALADVDRFASAVGDAYAGLGATGATRRDDTDAGVTTVVGKAHSVQLPAATTSQQWLERLQPRGTRRAGYWAANVDAVHAFPGLAPRAQAAVAVANALNDCYAVGGVDDRRLRPLVAVPAGTTISAEMVTSWYDDGAPSGVTLCRPSVVEHDGTGWLFGARAVAAVTTRPAVRAGAVEPGDAVLLHRPLGALAMYSLSVDSPSDTVRERATAALTADHRDAARVLASFCPDLGEPFDPARHLKVVTDISGPGIGGLARLLSPHRLHLTALPFLDPDAVDRARERWVTPDATVETNGPLAVVARPAVVDRVRQELPSAGDESPTRIGEVRAPTEAACGSGLTATDDVALGRYVERYAREDR